MDQKSSKLLFTILPGVFLAFAFLYIILVVKPVFYFHHVQPPFLLSPVYFREYFIVPGGVSELLASFFMQSFYYRMLGPVVFMGIVLLNMLLATRLMNLVYKHPVNVIWAMIPPVLAIVLTNNYNFPFSVPISMVLLLVLLILFLQKAKSTAGKLILYSISAALIYYLSGSGYLILFSGMALLFSINLKDWRGGIVVLYIAGFVLLIPHWVSESLLPLPADQNYLSFFLDRLYFMPYEPSPVIYMYLCSVLMLPGFARLASLIQTRGIQLEQALSLKTYTAISYTLLISLSIIGHFETFSSDAKKTVASDYYCYMNQADKAGRVARGLKNYNFATNLNYTLAMGKSGRLADDFFKFFQISGTDALHPDVEFASEMSFIATDFYYDLGYISEARHWAYESLVFYPYSPRALQMLVKIHLVTGEFKAARRCLDILSNTLIDRKFTEEYQGYLLDTALISSHREIMEKRSFIPREKELSPFIEERFRELLETNAENKRAYEYLLVYYLLDSKLEEFMTLYKDASKYFDGPADIFEEAVLLYVEENNLHGESGYSIRPETMDRYTEFNKVVQQHKGKTKLARNYLYWEMGDSYLYYARYVYPRIVKPEIVIEENEEPSI